jgi:hypothetical protein
LTKIQRVKKNAYENPGCARVGRHPLALLNPRPRTIYQVTGVPRVIHNIGAGAREENIVFRYAIIGHFRLEAP